MEDREGNNVKLTDMMSSNKLEIPKFGTKLFGNSGHKTPRPTSTPSVLVE